MLDVQRQHQLLNVLLAVILGGQMIKVFSRGVFEELVELGGTQRM